MDNQHYYQVTVEWTGNNGEGTSGCKTYERSHTITAGGKEVIPASSDPAFRGDPDKYNPEELMVASLSSCHMLWYLHLCAKAGIVVTAYIDQPTGTMVETSGTGGHFTEVVLNPVVTITDGSMISKANELHKVANKLCFIANSVNFPIHHQPICKTEEKN